MIRMLGALSLVLAMLGGALWAVRRFDVQLPGRISGGRSKRVELVERLAVDAKRSVALIRRDGCEHLILMGPEGHAMIETGITPTEKAPSAPVAAPVAAVAPAPVARPTTRRGQRKPQPALEPAAAAESPVPAFATYIDLPQAPRRHRERARVTARWNRAAVREALNA